ncbi:MAG: hypothetical protein ACREX9_11380 [Gammaproteobacteria bacterium]
MLHRVLQLPHNARAIMLDEQGSRFWRDGMGRFTDSLPILAKKVLC